MAHVSMLALAIAVAVVSVRLFREDTERRRQAARERRLLAALRAGLPADCHLLSDLELPRAAGQPVRIWAAVVGPGGVAVVRACSAGGELHAAGSVWVVREGAFSRLIPSPAEECRRAAEALRAAAGLWYVPVQPLVVLTDPRGVYHPAPAAAMVVGGPHLAAAVDRCLGGQALTAREALGVAQALCIYQRS